jgi:hypothetical protein
VAGRARHPRQGLNIEELANIECREIVRQIRAILSLDYSDDETNGTWNPDREWNIETLEYVAGVLAGLKPPRP